MEITTSNAYLRRLVLLIAVLHLGMLALHSAQVGTVVGEQKQWTSCLGREEISGGSPLSAGEGHVESEQDGVVPEGLTAGDWTSIRAAYEAGRHAAYADEDGYRARNPGQQSVTRFDGRGFTTSPDEGGRTWGLELQSYGFSGAERPVEGPAPARAEGSRVVYPWDDTLEEWYVNEPRGLEHGYTVRERPPRDTDDTGGQGPLTFTLALRGGLRPQVMEDERGA